MTIQAAQQLSIHVSKLVELTTIFNIHYGRDYRLTEASPIEAWDLYRLIMAEQAQIANLLSPNALAVPFVRYEAWWEHRDVINTALVSELAQEALRLVSLLAALTATDSLIKRPDYVRTTQETIAGLLHPAVRQQALQHSGSVH